MLLESAKRQTRTAYQGRLSCRPTACLGFRTSDKRDFFEYCQDPPETDEADGGGSEMAFGLRPMTVVSGRRDEAAGTWPS